MNVPIWSHQITTSYLESEIGPDDAGRPFSEVWVKTHDGLYMQSTWDHHPLAVSDAQSLKRLARGHAAAGRNVRPWCVVKGLQPEEEGRLAAEMAIAAAEVNLTQDAVIMIDLEPYYHGGPGNPQFWRSDLFNDGADRARRLLNSFLEHGGKTAWIAGDVRAGHLDAVSYGAWAAHGAVSLHTPQTYYTIFDAHMQGPETPVERARMHIDRANTILASFGVRDSRIAHILPAEGNPDVLLDAFKYCHSLGQQKPSVWQRVNLTETNADRLNGADDPWHEDTPPPPVDTTVGRETRIEPIGMPVVDWTEKDDERLISMRVRIVRDS
jgi:hypothetical protein